MLLDAAKSGYTLVDEALEAVREREGVTQGNLRLATAHTLSYYFMPDVVSTFVRENPHVLLSVMCRSSTEVVQLVESGKADIGFTYDAAVASPDLTSIALFEDEMCLIIGEDKSAKGPLENNYYTFVPETTRVG